ncbi:MAG: type VI secretion system membrane subunit TssM [Acetobacteraceae bacterium]|nr:type VI secretion system membrane subunit TssM [Acetobacteraceae bacterium]
MGAVIAFLSSRWFLTGIGAALLAVLVWFLGPLLSLLEDWPVRLGIVLAIALVWFGVNFWIMRRRARADAALVEGAAGGAAAADASAEEVAAMREKLTTALDLLRRARGTRGYLYEQPWYVIIGPPGAGKTTALLNAGLQFPLAAEMGQGAVAGVGGTRMCDWWFTENAVLIDTAGRYTTQDSDAGVDRAGWEGFLDLLKRTRPRQPLNGVLVAIAITDIATASPTERSGHARAIRKRIKEVTDRLGVRVPVYAIVTKADLLAGFSEYFDDLDREKRAQVWGHTFDVKLRDGEGLAGFGEAFRAIVARLDGRLIDRLQAERSPERRAALAGFPAQVASLEAPLTSFLQEAFGGSKLDPAPFLRGVYFASGTQEGTPIDRLTGALSRAFGLDQKRAPSLRPEQGRSYFLGRLLRDVVFGEAMLVSEKPGAARRRWLIRGGAFAAIGLLTLGLAGMTLRAQSRAQAEIDASAQAIAAYEATAAKLTLDPVNDADMPTFLALLEQARALPYGYGRGGVSEGWSLGLGQAEKLSLAANTVYRHALDRVLLPRLIWRLESQIRGNINRPDFVYEATRIYLMLGTLGPLDRPLVKEWLNLDWGQTWPGPGAEPFREAMARHADALLENPLPALPLDGALVEEARRTFSRVTLAERVYSRIRPLATAAGVRPWRPADAAGASGARVFVRGSGKPLTEGIAGFYTVDGFHRVVLPSLPKAAREVASESWVLGTRSEIDPSSPQMLTLQQDVVKLYTDEYAKQWDALLADINVVPMRSMNQAVQDLYLLSSPQSPMRDLLAGIARQLTLSVPPPPPAGGAAGAAAAAQGAAATAAAAAAAQSAAGRLAAVIGQGAAAGPPPEPPGKAIDDRYKALRDFVGTGPGAPIDMVLKLLNDLQQQLSRIASAPVGGAPPVPTGDDPARLLLAEASRQPQPVARWLQGLASGGSSLRGGGAKAQVAAAAAGPGGPASLCGPAVNGRYPFFRNASEDTPLDDFARLFAPAGLLDAFFTTQLRQYVDITGRNWRPQAMDGVEPPVSASDVAQFQRAAVIRDLFFSAGGNTPSVRFDITPMSIDPGAKKVSIDFDGVVVSYEGGPTRSTQINWPGANRMTNVKLTFDPPPTIGTGVLSANGPWALFRLFNQGQLVQAGSAERYRLTFRQGERQAVFEVRAGSVLNPFAPGVLQEFRCPALR